MGIAAAMRRDDDPRATYVCLWVLALAFGWIEAAVVIYLRELYLQDISLYGASGLSGLQVTLVSPPTEFLPLEVVREVCTMLLLGAVAWLAGRRLVDRAGAFLLSFGVWDLTYYAVLWLIVGWPESLRTWDILFLIPLPWVAPVWAPMTAAAIFVLAGSYVFWTPARQRSYRWTDIAMITASAVVVIAAFLWESQAAIDHRLPERFPLPLFWVGVGLGTAWFLRVERRAARADVSTAAGRPARGTLAHSGRRHARRSRRVLSSGGCEEHAHEQRDHCTDESQHRAGIMYLLDPQGGRRRRAQVRDVVVHGSHAVNTAAGAASRDLQHRVAGVAARTPRILGLPFEP